ncbi:MAG: hypothetical protein ACNFW9_00130 [Candidatus Kerfeldbacteria bacterium]
MANNDINKWLEQARAKGLSDMEIQNQLKAQGWSDIQINKVLVGAYHKQNNTLKDKEKIFSPAEKFQKETRDQEGREKENNAFSGTASFPGIGDLFSYSWDLYKRKIGKLLVILIITGLISSVLLGIVFAIFGFTLFSSGLEFIGDIFYQSPYILYAMGFIGMLLFVFLIALVFTLMQIALILTIHHEGVSIGTILGNAFKLVLPMWWVNIIVGFLTMGAGMLLGIPGIIFSIWFSLAIYILVLENVRGMQAVLRSKEFVRGYWWQVLISNVVLSLAIGIPIMILNFGLLAMDQYLISQIISNLFYILAIPFGFCFNYAIYRSLTDLKGAELPIPQKKWHLITTSVVGWASIPLIIIALFYYLDSIWSWY